MAGNEYLSSLSHRLGYKEGVLSVVGNEQVAKAIGVFEQDVETLVGGDWTLVTRGLTVMRIPPQEHKYLFVMPENLGLETDLKRQSVQRLVVFCSDKRFAAGTFNQLSIGRQSGTDAFIVVPGGAVQPKKSVNTGNNRQEALSTLLDYSLTELPNVDEILLLGHLDTCAAIKVHMLSDCSRGMRDRGQLHLQILLWRWFRHYLDLT